MSSTVDGASVDSRLFRYRSVQVAPHFYGSRICNREHAHVTPDVGHVKLIRSGECELRV
jgi:hypothetical protein